MRLIQERVKPRVFSVSQVLHRLNLLYLQCKDVAHRQKDGKVFRKVITLSNSLAIVLMQFEMTTDALKTLKKAVKTDVLLFFNAPPENRLWIQRPLIYANLGYLLLRLNDPQGSLKFLYDSESLLMEMEIDVDTKDLSMSHALLSCLVLYKLQKPQQAVRYLDLATAHYNSLAKGERRSRFNIEACSNIYCLIHIAGEVVQERAHLKKVHRGFRKRKTAAVNLLEKCAYARSRREAINVMLSDEFASLLFITCFFPFIAQTTPIISLDELTRAQERNKHKTIVRANLHFTVPHRLRHDGYDHYATIMKDALNGMSEHLGS